jgi:hypothetical protein
MAASSQKQLNQQKKVILRKFADADVNGDGSISKSELRDVFRQLDPSWTRPAKMEALFDAIDTNDDNRIDLIEFVDWMFGKNKDVQKVIDQMSYDTLRLWNCWQYTWMDLHACLGAFGTVRHLHHVRGQSQDSNVVFASQDDAKAAFTAFAGSEDRAAEAFQQGQQAPPYPGFKVAAKLDNVIGLCFSEAQPGVVALTGSTCSPPGHLKPPPSFYSELIAGVKRLRLKGDTSWQSRASNAFQRCKTIPQAAILLRGLSVAVMDYKEEADDPEGEDDPLGRWQKTMRSMGKGHIDFLGEDCITNALRELLSFAILSEDVKDGAYEMLDMDGKIKMVEARLD